MKKNTFIAWNKKKNEMSEEFSFNAFDGDYFIPENWYLKDMIIRQFIGLKDKNGRKIYEGDVIDDGSDIGYISYMNETTEYIVDYWKEGQTQSNGGSLSSLGDVEVIGNIYENKDLIK